MPRKVAQRFGADSSIDLRLFDLRTGGDVVGFGGTWRRPCRLLAVLDFMMHALDSISTGFVQLSIYGNLLNGTSGVLLRKWWSVIRVQCAVDFKTLMQTSSVQSCQMPWYHHIAYKLPSGILDCMMVCMVL